jgi:hypothetical protein
MEQMARYRLIVFTEPVEGREVEFNTWYDTQHLADVVAVPGFVSAQRFKLKECYGGEFKQRYLAIYELDSQDHAAAMRELLGRAGTGTMVLSAALDSEKTAFAVFEEWTPLLRAVARDGSV